MGPAAIDGPLSRPEPLFRAVYAFELALGTCAERACTGCVGLHRAGERRHNVSKSQHSHGASRAGRPPSRRIASMANTKSAKKAARQMVTRTEVNKNRRSAVKTEVRKVEEAIASGN